MSKLTALSIGEALDGLKAKKFSVVELTREYIAAQEKW